MSYQVLMNISEDGKQVWFCLYENDARKLRCLLAPGTSIVIRGVVSTYEVSGGYNPDDSNPRLSSISIEADVQRMADGELRIRDRIQLDVSSLVLVVDGSENNEET